MNLSQLQSAQNILIYGYGIEGTSTESFLRKHKIHFEIHDDNNPKYNEKKDLDTYDVIIVSAGIKRDEILKSAAADQDDKMKFTSNTELFFHNITKAQRQKIIGITGTKGKSMTAKLTYEMLADAGKKSLLAGNIGVAPLDILSRIDDIDYVVLELSSYQLNYLDRSPHIALCTNLFEDHLDWHGDKEHYHKAKANLWKYQDTHDWLFVPDKYKKQFPTRAISCLAISKENAPDGSIWQAPHYRENFGLVAQLAEHLSINQTVFIEALSKLEPLPHRLHTVGVFQGITFIDNAISTNQYSTMADLIFFGDKLGSLLLGGEERGQDFTPLFQYIQGKELHTTLIIPESNTSERILQELEDNFPAINAYSAETMNEAVALGYKHTRKGRICLLSPAAASWDRYKKGYIEKGKAFIENVKKQSLSS